jgi:hypothetical protein
MNWMTFVLGVIAAVPPVAAAATGLFYFRLNKTKKLGEIGIDDQTRNKLAQDAAMINQQREQEREQWWGRQVKTLRDEINDERTLSNRRFRRLNQIENWATRHVSWDRKAWALLLEQYPDFEPPPPLPDEIVRSADNNHRDE